jgi:hydrogenase expression/formation protein HypE
MEQISLAHGNGGRLTRDLIEKVFKPHFANPLLDLDCDAAFLPPLLKPCFATDGYTVKPIFFPGGDIGSLAIHGAINDLAVSGAAIRYISLAFIIEEGFLFADLEKIAQSIARACQESHAVVVVGDTKVVPKGEAPGVYLMASAIGERFCDHLAPRHIRAGDCLIASGTLGDHGAAVMLAREEFGLSGDLPSDSASVLALAQSAAQFPGLRAMRDPTRGGLATACHELAKAAGCMMEIFEAALPINDAVRTIAAILGYDPLYFASEGKIIALIAKEEAEGLLASWRLLPEGQHAAIIGVVHEGVPQVILKTAFGGKRLVPELSFDPLPRIC